MDKPAFPFVSNGGYHEHQSCSSGMSLRDYFAGQALAGFGAHPSNPDKPEHIARYCYQIADAMIKESEE